MIKKTIFIMCAVFLALFTVSVLAESFEWTIYADPANITKEYQRDVSTDRKKKEYSVDIGQVFVLSTGPNFFSRRTTIKGYVKLDIIIKDNRKKEIFKERIEVDKKKIDYNKWSMKQGFQINKIGEIFLVDSSHAEHNLLDQKARLLGKIYFNYSKPYTSNFASVTVKDKVKPLYGSEELSNIRNLVKNDHHLYRLGHDLGIPVAVGSSNPKILIGFSSDSDKLSNLGDVAEVHDKASYHEQDVVYVCLDADENGECDYLFAEDACEGNADFYNFVCCGDGDTHDKPGTFNSDLNAFCTRDKNNNPIWLPLDYVGEIFEFSSYSLLVTPFSDYAACGNVPNDIKNKISVSQKDDNSFYYVTHNNEVHSYYCKSGKWLECGGEHPFSSFNSVKTGYKLSVSPPLLSDVYYCSYYFRDHPSLKGMWAMWEHDLDNFIETCYAAGFNHTGTKCCGDKPNEYYEDPWTIQPLSETPGVCEDSKYIPDGTIYSAGNKLLVNKGINLMCVARLGNCSQIIDGVDDDGNSALCTPIGWVKGESDDFIDLVKKSTSWPSDVPSFCCSPDSCWNGSSCVGEDSSFFNGSDYFYCKDADWISGFAKSDWSDSKRGFCIDNSQCLVDPDFNLYVTSPDAFWNTENNQKPMCINSDDFILDNFCLNGEWSSRTALLANNLYDIGFKNYPNSFSFYCANPEEVLLDLEKIVPVGSDNVWLRDLFFSCKKGSFDIPCVNNVCLLKSGSNIIFSLSLNVPFNDAEKSFLYALDLNKNVCDSGSGFRKCGNNPLWYIPEINSLIYSNVNNVDSFSYEDFFSSKFVSFLSEVNKFNGYAFFKKPSFSNVFFLKKGDKEIFSFLELNKTINEINYLGVEFKDFNLGSSCFDVKNNFKGVDCSSNYFFASEFTLSPRWPSNPLPFLTDYWRDLTAKLRLK
jgi:hypothetical protein